jgi:hypothetical protein
MGYCWPGPGLSVLLVEAVLIVALLPRPPQGPAACFKPGMTLAEVEAILGPGADTPAPAGGAQSSRERITSAMWFRGPPK